MEDRTVPFSGFSDGSSSYYSISPFIRNDALINLFNLLEDRAYKALNVYLTNHGWNDEAKRLTESRFIGVGTYRLLTNILVEHLDGSPENLIDFYEECKRPKDDPHYEDLIVAVLINLVVGIIANLCYDLLKKKAHRLQNSKELAQRLWKVFGRGIDYLFRARWIRNMLWRKQISKSDHAVLLEYLRRKYLAREKQAEAKVDSNILLKMESEFQGMAKKHDLELADMQTSLVVELIELASSTVELIRFLEEFRTLLKESGGHYEDG